MLKVTAAAIVKELARRNIPYEIIDAERSMVQYMHKGTWRYIRSALDDSSSPVGVSIADSKPISSRLVRAMGIQAPDELILKDDTDLEGFLNTYGTVVVKPADAAHGDGVTINISDMNALAAAITIAKKHSVSGIIIVQQQVDGNDLRVLVIGGKVAAATERVSALVTGDGVSTILQLIEQENENPDRGENYTKKLNVINMDAVRSFLKDNVHAVAKKGEKVQVVGPVNIGLGGTSTDKTDIIPASIAAEACAIAEKLHLNVCGVDFITSDMADETKYFYIEANSCPSFGLHLYPAVGKTRPVDVLFVDHLLNK